MTEKEGRKRSSPLRIVLISIVFIGLLAAIGLGTSHAVWESIVKVYSANLRTILDADIAALRIWIRNEINYAQAQAKTPILRREVKKLVDIHRQYPGDAKKIQQSESLRILQNWALPEDQEQDYWGFFVVSVDGTIVASVEGGPYIGLSVTEQAQKQLEPVFAGDSVLEKPQLLGSYIKDTVDLEGQPIIVTAVPVYGSNSEVIAAYGRVLNPDKDFTRILSVARMGENGDTYAFDSDGFLLSDSRFEEQLQKIGLLPDNADARSILTVQTRDPGGDMTKGFQPTTPAEDRPLTRMAQAAISGSSGIDLNGYRDYRGVMVIGAWEWLPEYGFGVATELPESEAFSGHRPVKIAFTLLFLALVSACGWFLYSSISIHRLKKRIEEIRQLGQYELLEKIGEGGMGKVYKARHAMLKRPTAVKFIRPEMMTEEMVNRFEREVQLTSSLTHPNTIQVYDYGQTESGIFYYAMEYLQGITLAQLSELSGPVTVARVIYILRHVCYSLEEAHDIGLIHRDIKPMNIMLCARGGQFDAVKVLDFGLAKEIATKNTDLTVNQGIIGTPVYIAPERLEGKDGLDVRSDIYSLGSVAYNLLTGQDVFIAPTAVEVCYQVMKSAPEPPSSRLGQALPQPLEHLVLACLAKNPAERPATVREIIRVLEDLQEEQEWEQEQAQRWWSDNNERIAACIDM
jgi:tRNA A-37 threonylcarbamoyl transferase component Bud32